MRLFVISLLEHNCEQLCLCVVNCGTELIENPNEENGVAKKNEEKTKREKIFLLDEDSAEQPLKPIEVKWVERKNKMKMLGVKREKVNGGEESM